MLMAAADLLARTPTPTRPQVEDAIGGVLCRCTGYLKIVEAVLDVAGGLHRGRDCRRCHAGCAVGARLPRVDGWPKVAGTDRFGADEAPADALWMRVVRSPHARARFTLGDLEAVKARTPGLVAILTAKDVPGENSFGIFPKLKDQPVLAPGFVRFRGEAVLALVGTRGRRRGPLGCRSADRLAARDAARRHRGRAGAGDASDPRRRARQRADARQPHMRRRRGRTRERGRDGRGQLRDRRSSSTPTSSRRPATPCPSATARTASRSRPARRRPTWTWRRPRACWASTTRACASARPPAAAASAASSTCRCSRCWRWRRG